MILLLGISAIVGTVAVLAIRAPLGWEDANGWHAGEEPTAARLQFGNQFPQFQHRRVLHGRDISAPSASPSSGNAGSFSPKSVEN